MATDTQVFGVSTDTTDSHKKFCEQEKLNFPLLSDTEAKVSKVYDACMPLIKVSNRVTIIIDKQGIIRKVDRQVNAGSHGKDLEVDLRKLYGE